MKKLFNINIFTLRFMQDRETRKLTPLIMCRHKNCYSRSSFFAGALELLEICILISHVASSPPQYQNDHNSEDDNNDCNGHNDGHDRSSAKFPLAVCLGSSVRAVCLSNEKDVMF